MIEFRLSDEPKDVAIWHYVRSSGDLDLQMPPDMAPFAPDNEWHGSYIVLSYVSLYFLVP